jgi:uncharacterized protein (TIGR03435 family)
MLRVLLIALLVATATLSAQERTAKVPLVEVASVKENKSGGTVRTAVRGGPERFGAINLTLRGLLESAYGSTVLGGPDWADTIRFDVVGIGDPTQSKLLRLQEVLRDRFAVKVRRESRQFDIYALVLARRDGRLGPGLRTSSDCPDEAQKKLLRVRPGEPACGTIRTEYFPPQGKRLRARGIQLLVLGGYLDSGRPVFERTGLNGYFDVDLEWASVPFDDGPTIFTAVQDQLGLKLESTKAPLDVLVIDHAERPKEN